MQSKALWVLRIGVAGEFVGHGMFAIQGKALWVGWIVKLLGVSTENATTLLHLIGYADLITAGIILFIPIPAVLLWAALWGFWTAILRPIVGESLWDFVERWGNWAAPLALLLISYPKPTLRSWFTPIKVK